MILFWIAIIKCMIGEDQLSFNNYSFFVNYSIKRNNPVNIERQVNLWYGKNYQRREISVSYTKY